MRKLFVGWRHIRGLFGVLVLAVAAGCAGSEGGSASAGTDAAPASKRSEKSKYVIGEADTAGFSQAIFAGGCFWCEETAFEGVAGVKSVISGYVGGKESNPTYEQVSYGKTDHAEAVMVSYDPELISYEQLLEIFWVNHDPTTNDRQFCDRGRQYRPGIFYLDDEQKRLAEKSVDWARKRARFKQPIVTEISPATAFWAAEEYHQDFYKKNPLRYQSYRAGCRRDARLAELWGESAAKH